MLTALRTLVSGPRSRTRDGALDLDLSYITPTLIATSFPASGPEAFWRNSLADLAVYLHRKHVDRFLVFNLSERHYDGAPLAHRVVELGFPDHHAPPLAVCWTLCLTMHSWLAADPLAVACVHCLAGKGRTGVLISCYLLFSGALFAAPAPGVPTFLLPPPAALAQQALALFAEKRGDSITYASQQRTVRYFARVIHAAIVAENGRLAVGGGGGGGGGGGSSPTPPLPAWELAPEAPLPAASGSSATAKPVHQPPVPVFWDAVLRVRALRNLPLPRVVALRVKRLVFSGLLRRETTAEAHEQQAFVPPRVRITTAPYQGGLTRTLYDSSVEAESVAEGKGGGGRGRMERSQLLWWMGSRWLFYTTLYACCLRAIFC